MSCESNPNRIARLACTGVSHLSSKRGFYAGLALSGLGLAGLALARRVNQPGRKPARFPAGPAPITVPGQRIPQLPARRKISPTGAVPAGERCAGCRTPAGSKAGPWYTLDDRVYCPDCAPQAAAKTGVDLLLPEQKTVAVHGSRPDAVVIAGRSSALSSGPRPPIAAAAPRPPEYLPAEGRVKTKLVPSRIRLCMGLDSDRPVWLVAENGQVVLRPDGRDTGLALTPSLKLPERPGGPVREDTGQWWLTHISSGKTLGSQPYESPEEAGLLAGLLAQVDWTRDEEELTTAELKKVNTTIAMFNQLLAEEKKKRGAGGSTPSTSIPAPAAPGEGNRPPVTQPGESLAGKIVTDDGYGGIVRVLADDGARLLVIDSLGSRYEVERANVRPPLENDFEAVRVAMSFDPTEKPAEKCATCGQLAGQAATGASWYRMDRKSYCPSCATSHAAQEGYELDAEIGSDL